MSEAADDGEEPKKKKSGLLVSLVLAIISAGGAFAYTSGMLGGSNVATKQKATMLSDGLAFVPVEPMTIAIGKPSDHRFLRFRAELEVAEGFKDDVTKLMPRVVDVMNTYLQSLEMEDIEDPTALLTLRSQLRRRVDLIVGGDRVHDLLVMEFVVN